MPDVTVTNRSRIRRKAERGVYDRAAVNAILDEALFCHVGFAVDDQPVVLPTIHARIDETLYLHGAAANNMLKSLAGGIEACVTATLIDGVVFARSWFHHSVNYRSVVVFGQAEPVEDEDEKWRGLQAVVEHIAQGRAGDSRPPTPTEMRSTLLLRMPILEASAKVRTGGPIDDEDDLALTHWAGHVPLRLVAEAAVADAVPSAAQETLPGYLTRWMQGR